RERGDHEDVSAARGEVGERGSGQAEDGREVRPDDAIPVLVGGLGDVREAADARVVHEDLQAVVGVHGRLDGVGAGTAVAQVAHEGAGLAAVLLDLRDQRIELGRRARDRDHARARPAESEGDRAADAASGAGHERGRALRLHPASIGGGSPGRQGRLKRPRSGHYIRMRTVRSPAMEYRDYYKVLGVPKDASDADIKAAYRKLARKYHPDMNKGDKKSEARFKEINEANEVLSDPEKRRKYDQLGSNWAAYDRPGA